MTASEGPEVESDRDRVAWGLDQDSDLAVVWGVCSCQMMYRAAYLEVSENFKLMVHPLFRGLSKSIFHRASMSLSPGCSTFTTWWGESPQRVYFLLWSCPIPDVVIFVAPSNSTAMCFPCAKSCKADPISSVFP